MAMFILGLVIFLGVHSTRVFAEGWRSATIARVGEKPWKGIYSVVSVASFVLLIWGYGQARHQMPLWDPPAFMGYVTVLLMLPVFVLFVASYVPRNGIKAKLHHPMVLSVKLWALAHLLSNGSLADVLLFGGFLAWAILSFAAARKRDRAAGTVYPAGTLQGTLVCVVAGLAVYAAFMMGLHAWMIGVRPYLRINEVNRYAHEKRTLRHLPLRPLLRRDCRPRTASDPECRRADAQIRAL